MNSFVDRQLSNFLQYFQYSTYYWQYTTQIGDIAATAMDRKAGDHVIKARSNYTSTVRIISEVINSTRDFIINDIAAQRKLVGATIPEIETVSYDLTQILRGRSCPSRSIQSFLSNIYDSIRLNIEDVVSNAAMSSGQVLWRGAIPTYLIEDLFYKLQSCLYSHDIAGLKCLLRVEDFYLSPTVNLVRESLIQLEQYIASLNYRIGQALIYDIEHEMIHAYQSVFKYNCFATTPSPSTGYNPTTWSNSLVV